MANLNPDGGPSAQGVRRVSAPRDRFSPGLTISAAFLFSIGDLYREVKIDPDLYFEGEEISYAVRAYTYGYDLYAAHFPIVYHYFLRKTDRKHWDDHVDWGQRSLVAKARMRSLLEMTNEVADLGPYGLGTVRTIEEYEGYAGVDFKNRFVNVPGEPAFPVGKRGIRARLSRKIQVHPDRPFFPLQRPVLVLSRPIRTATGRAETYARRGLQEDNSGLLRRTGHTGGRQHPLGLDIYSPLQ